MLGVRQGAQGERGRGQGDEREEAAARREGEQHVRDELGGEEQDLAAQDQLRLRPAAAGAVRDAPGHQPHPGLHRERRHDEQRGGRRVLDVLGRGLGRERGAASLQRGDGRCAHQVEVALLHLAARALLDGHHHAHRQGRQHQARAGADGRARGGARAHRKGLEGDAPRPDEGDAGRHGHGLRGVPLGVQRPGRGADRRPAPRRVRAQPTAQNL
mmetsp:Transcript_31223/g.79756  ORF Transcript_31223/g.79756 Transcript_31223/m.79756 type:complete len:214 (+) Transcript_31223:491-1132(+)